MKTSSSWRQIIAQDLFTVWIIAVIAACVGFAINQLRDTPLSLVYTPKAERLQQTVNKIASDSRIVPGTESAAPDGNLPSVAAEVRQLDLPAFRDIVESKTKGIVLDARPEIFHRLGHVPGAISLSREEFEADYAKHRSLLEKDKSQLIAVYCSSSSCEDSQMVADALVKLSFTRVFVFKGGWSDWSAAGLPEEKAQ